MWRPKFVFSWAVKKLELFTDQYSCVWCIICMLSAPLQCAKNYLCAVHSNLTMHQGSNIIEIVYEVHDFMSVHVHVHMLFVNLIMKSVYVCVLLSMHVTNF